MRYWTYSEIKDKVEKDLGIEQEEFITASELMGYCNEAIDEAEAEIHSIYEDYFLTYTTINLVSGTALYSLPSDIYANKIRGIMHKDGTLMYPVRRVKELDKFEEIMATNEFNTSGRYRYILVNTSASNGIQLNLIPPARDNITAGLKLWYIRNANRITSNTDFCDIPEFVHFVIQYMKLRVYEKEGHPNVGLAARLVDQQRKQMVSTLTNMIPDADNEVEKDLTFYEEMV